MSVSTRVLKSSGLLLAIQLIQRSLGLISTLILARLLTPNHFGIVALVAIALQFFEVLADAGNKNYIIQKTSVDDTDLNTAWTLDLIIKSTMCVVIVISSPFLASYFDAPELTLALSIASLALPLRALRNPGLMLLAKHLAYKPVFVLNVWQKIFSFVTVVSIAMIDPSYWAIIAGNLVAAGILAAGSYQVDNHRPRLTLAHVKQQWHFSKWLIMRGVVGFTRSQIDNLIISKAFGPTQLGGYHLIRQLSTFPAISIIVPGSEPLQAAIAENKTDPSVLTYRIRLSLMLIVTVLLPITTFMMAYPELIVNVLLGADWNNYGILLRPFGLFFFTFALFELVSNAFLAIGAVRALFLFDLASTTLIIITLLAITNPSLTEMAWARGWLAVATTIALLVILNHKTAFGIGRLMLLGLPALVAALMGLAMAIFVAPIAPTTPFFRLLFLGSVFMVTFIPTLISILWYYQAKCYEFRHLAAHAAQVASSLKETSK